MQTYLIDAHNIIRTNPGLAKFEKENGSEKTEARFIQMCVKAMVENEHWVVVFDGPGQPENIQPEKGALLEIIFSLELKADDIILDKARLAARKGAEVIIASSDFALHEPGIEKISAHDFYDILASRPVLMDDTTSSQSGITPQAIIDRMVRLGHLPQGAPDDKSLSDEIQNYLDYYEGQLPAKANKAAGKIEGVLRSHAKVSPDPDPEIEVRRALKEILKS